MCKLISDQRDLPKTLQDPDFFFFSLARFVDVCQLNLIGQHGLAPDCSRAGHNIVYCASLMIQLEQGHGCMFAGIAPEINMNSVL